MLTYIRPNTLSLLLGIAAAIPLLVSCGSDDLTAPTDGTIQVTTATSGEALDSDGYTVSVDGATPVAIGIVGLVNIPNVEPGDHPVVLGGVAANCRVGSGINQRIATVPVGDTVRVAFAVTCESVEPPPENPIP
jgi:hypothetical protein